MTDEAKTPDPAAPADAAAPAPSPLPAPAPAPAPAPEASPSPPAAIAPAPGAAALLLLDIGAPENEADAGPFLQRLYGDPHVLQLSLAGTFLDLIAWGISLSRGKALRAALHACGGAAPERAELEKLAGGLAKGLTLSSGRAFQPFVAFRHAEPSIPKALEQIRAAGCRRVVALFARTFPSSAGSASTRKELSLCAEDLPELDVSMVDGFEGDAGVRKAVAAGARGALETIPADAREGAHLLFLLQGQPVRGALDPTLERARAFAEAVREAMGVQNAFSVAYQNGVDPRATLLPTAAEEIARIAADKRPALVLVPVAHACEGLATRWELDQELVPQARSAGIAHVVRAPAPAEREDFRAALEDLLARHLAEMESLRAAG